MPKLPWAPTPVSCAAVPPSPTLECSETDTNSTVFFDDLQDVDKLGQRRKFSSTARSRQDSCRLAGKHQTVFDQAVTPPDETVVVCHMLLLGSEVKLNKQDLATDYIHEHTRSAHTGARADIPGCPIPTDGTDRCPWSVVESGTCESFRCLVAVDLLFVTTAVR